MALDENIVQLVEVLNSLPGVRTLGSCGGHPDPTVIQTPSHSFFVTFRLARTKGGWDTLAILGWAVFAFTCEHFADVSIGVHSSSGSGIPGIMQQMYFSISGTGGGYQTPIEFAEFLRTYVVEVEGQK